jgi:Tfp pilus assembly protein PilP
MLNSLKNQKNDAMSRSSAPNAANLPPRATWRVFLLPALLWLPLALPAQPLADDAPKSAAEEAPFEYVLTNRPDPFLPFITEKAATTAGVDLNEIVESSEPLTGMQLFEPGQLTLVGILKTGSADIAMVEDFTGKGYTLSEGTKIGRRGVVKDITGNAVIIEETAETRAGNKIVTEVVMALKKEGE